LSETETRNCRKEPSERMKDLVIWCRKKGKGFQSGKKIRNNNVNNICRGSKKLLSPCTNILHDDYSMPTSLILELLQIIVLSFFSGLSIFILAKKDTIFGRLLATYTSLVSYIRGKHRIYTRSIRREENYEKVLALRYLSIVYCFIWTELAKGEFIQIHYFSGTLCKQTNIADDSKLISTDLSN